MTKKISMEKMRIAGLVLGFLLALEGCSTHAPSTRATALRNPAQTDAPTKWSYDAGPDLSTPMGRELVDLNSEIPYFPGISSQLLGSQKFRPAFGPIPWRMLQKPNSVKILFIGQDGTHIAEAAGRPATAGFGGRAQDLAKYFGVSSSAAFINTFAFTIKGQYGSFDTPVIQKRPDGTKAVKHSAYVDNQLWLMSQDQDSPLVQWRNHLIEWIIRNNRDSLQMIVTFGGAARDAAAVFVESRGGKVGTRTSLEELATLQVPEIQLTSAGGNNESPMPLSVSGGDFYEKLTGKKVDYTNPASLMDAQKAFDAAIKSEPGKWLGELAISGGGLSGSGVLHPAQLGGYDIDDKMQINGQKTISLKGLKISDDLVINRDLLVVQLPHPTALSSLTPQEASERVGEALEDFKPYVDSGWKIEADPGFVNSFAAGQPYKYARAQIGPEYYDFGAPASRMVAVSSASRLSSNVIIFGTRDKATFDEAAIKAMTAAQPSHLPAAAEMWTARPRLPESRYIFDAGPGEKFARIMKENISDELVQSHAVNGDFGHYRGTFKKPRVVVLADPDGYDDLITARALTGTRGQYLQGLMEDLGVNDQYLVIKTAPFSLVETDLADWTAIMAKTQGYREAVLNAVMAENVSQMIIADGIYAAQEIKRIFGDKSPCPIVVLARESGKKNAGIIEAAAALKAVSGFEGVTISGKMSDIPRTHMSYYARVWEGTSGDRALTSTDPKYAGQAFAEVAPEWAYRQKYEMPASETAGVQKLIGKITGAKLRKGGEAVPAFLDRLKATP